MKNLAAAQNLHIFKNDIYLRILFYSHINGVSSWCPVETATAGYFYGSFAYEICFYGIYFYGIYIYVIYFYTALKF
jgi:hypothetical protein